ncbi:MAG: cell division protein FtsA [Parcubacteria group bacterium]|nr:cell division protein FtsA [Parcubacteria group bacterium]
MAKESIITGIDVGSSKVRVVVGEAKEDSKLPHVIGVGEASSEGMRRGTIVDVETAVSNISDALEKAERTSGVPIEQAIVSLGGNHVSSQKSKGVIAVSRADNEISEDDVTRVVEAASAVSVPPNHEIFHILPQNFKVDDQEGVKDPAGMSGVRLEVEATVIEGSSSAVKNLAKCMMRAGVDVSDVVISPLAAAESILAKKQKELGVVLIDIGGGSTSIVVFEEGNILQTSVLPIGAGHITNDLAIGMKTSVEVAEKVKLGYGIALPKEVSKKEEIDLAKMEKGEEEVVSRKLVAQIIEARLAEIMSLVNKELKKIDRASKLPAGAVLVGGGAKLPGVVDVVKEELGLPAQVGFPTELPGLAEKLEDPAYAVAEGLLLWGFNRLGEDKRFGGGVASINDTVGKLKKWFKHFLP